MCKSNITVIMSKSNITVIIGKSNISVKNGKSNITVCNITQESGSTYQVQWLSEKLRSFCDENVPHLIVIVSVIQISQGAIGSTCTAETLLITHRLAIEISPGTMRREER